MSRIGVATPRDDCPYAKSNANTFVRARAYRVFLTSCVGINLGDIPRGLRHPRDVPSVDPSTLGRKTLYELASLKYCYISTFASEIGRLNQNSAPLSLTLFLSALSQFFFAGHFYPPLIGCGETDRERQRRVPLPPSFVHTTLSAHN